MRVSKNTSITLTSGTLKPRLYYECKDNHPSTGIVVKCATES